MRCAQHLRAHDLVGGVEVEKRHRDGHGDNEIGQHALELVLDAFLSLDHLLGARQRLFADRSVGLIDASLFAHCLTTDRSSISKCSVAFGGITPPPAPRSPYAVAGGQMSFALPPSFIF